MSESLDNTLLRLQEIIKDNYPGVDIAPGTVLNELLLKLNSTLQNPITNDILEINQGNSISVVIDSTVDTFNEVVDKIASNYGTARNAGFKSVGKIKVVTSADRGHFIFKGSTFTQPVLKLNYITTSDYNVVNTPSAANEIQLFSENGLFYFILPVVAEEVGEVYQVADKTKFIVAQGNSISSFADAYAYGNFTSGKAMETDKELVVRFQQSIANKSLLTTKSITARLLELFPSLRDVSVIGANDAEMTRSKENLFGISTLGMTDVYVRTSTGPETVSIVKAATKTATRTENGARVDTWSISLTKDDTPGFYRIVSILPSGLGLVGKLDDVPEYSFDTTGFIPSNTVNNLFEGRFTQYQLCTTTFDYTLEDESVDEYNFDVVVSHQPYVADIQNLFLNGEERIACADYLVKAAIPCYVTIELTLHRKNTNIDLPVDKIKNDLFSYINSIKFGESIYASKLIDICHNYEVLYIDTPIKMVGDIYAPTGKILSISNSDVLTIPTNLALGVSPKTTVFFVDYFKSSELRSTMTDSIGIIVV